METGEIKYWNFVKIDGNYYYTDVSADDCGDTPAYTYFGINAESMSTERKIDLLSYGKLPKCDLNLEKPEIIEHEHVFDCEVEDEKYIVSCFCTKPSVYYKSCACGKKARMRPLFQKRF